MNTLQHEFSLEVWPANSALHVKLNGHTIIMLGQQIQMSNGLFWPDRGLYRWRSRRVDHLAWIREQCIREINEPLS